MDCSMLGFPVHHQLLELMQLMSIESVMPSNHLILCHPHLLPPSIISSIGVFFSQWVHTISVFYCAHFSMKCSLSMSTFLEEISGLFHSIVFLYFLHWSMRKAFLSLLGSLWNSAFKWVYLSFSPLPLAFLLFTAICKVSSDNHFAFLHFFFLWMVLIPASQCQEPPSIVLPALCLSDLIPCLFVTSTL